MAPPRYKNERDEGAQPDWSASAGRSVPPAPAEERTPAPRRKPSGNNASRRVVSARKASRRKEERTVIDDLKAPSKKGWTPLKAIFFFIFLPFQLIGMMTRKMHWFIMWPLRALLSIGFVGSVIAAILIIVYGTQSKQYDISQIVRMPERTIVLDRKGREIGTLHGENRRIVELNEVPQVFLDAVMLREDKRFFEHGGVDWWGVGRAVQQVARHHRATQGASTLTMQLAKTTYNHQDRNIQAKFLEVALAMRIEATYSKKEILKAYINRIFWGHTFLGISAAAHGYFDKEPIDLTVGESAMLAGIIFGPNEFSPYRNPEGAKEKRDIVLKILLDEGKITSEQYKTALAEPIATKRPVQRGEENYALDLIRREVDHIFDVLDAQNQEVKDDTIYRGGLIIRTTLDLDLQNAAIDSMNKHLNELEARRGYKHPTRQQYLALGKEERAKKLPDYVQSAAVVIDNSSGALLAVVGGRDGEESRFNRAIQARRQVGSLFKPFVYSAYFEHGGNPDSTISDGSIARGEIAGGGTWSPRNADGQSHGMRPASYGLLKSRNTMSVRVGNRAGLDKVIGLAQLAGFQGKIYRSPTMYLGTWEASPLDIAGAYTIFANGGVRPSPYIIESISEKAHNGETRERPIFNTRKVSRRVCTQRTANITSSILQQITKPGGTAGQTARLGFKAPCGGKTGTTNKYMNAWFCGFSSSVTTSVWVGFDKQRTIIDRGYGGTLALPIWVDIMLASQKCGYPQETISKTPKTSTAVLRLCRESGCIAHTGCEAAKAAYYETMPGIVPEKGICTKHTPIAEEVGENGPDNGAPTAEPVLSDEAPNAEEPVPNAIEVPDNEPPTAQEVPE